MKKMKKQFAVAIVAIMLLSILTATLTCLPTIVSATPWTPVEWQDDGKLKDWVRDKNGNFVDDLIEAQTGKVDIIVDLNGCIGEPANSEIVKYLNTLGDVVYVGKYVSFIIVKGVEGDRCVDIANRPEVAMVELATTDKWLGDNFRASKVETSAMYHPNTLQDFAFFGSWPGAISGKGINITFLDTGANSIYDPYVTHGYDAINDIETNPGPEAPTDDHASWMANWVFGLGGIAPQAGLVDIKVGDASGADSAAVMRALEKVYEKQRDWGINVVVMMFGGSASLDGRETRQQLIDLLSGQGIVVVASTGDNINNAPVTGTGAATRAIGVSAANIMNTVDRGDDVAPYVRGPRMDDGDMDLLDELKPEVIMPTGESDTRVSNSIATAMTSGLVALILEANSGMRNFDNKASGSVKDLLIRSAEPKGTADTTVAYPRSTPTWDQYWGFGEIDAFEVFQYLSGQVETGRTDLTFMGFDNTAHPSSPWYYSHAVETQSERDGRNIEAGVPDRIFARVYNNGSQDAHNVRVSFGFYPFTAGIPKFYDIGSVVTDIEGEVSDEIVSIDWTPPTLPAGEDHGCILVTIDYGLDSMFSGGSNFAQKNVQVQPASSPAVFTFRVENPLPTKAKIDLNVRTEACKHKDWTIKLSKTSFTMEPYECARTVQATVEPPAHVKPGTEALFFVTTYATAMGQEKGVEIGGVALKALGPTPPPGKPDLVIKDIKLTKLEGYCYVDYLISNTGTVSASASTTYLYVDGKKVASDSTSALASGASRWDRFTYRTAGAHTFKVCADGPNAISETNEANNCRTEELTCPLRLDIYFADGGESPGSVYHYNTTTGIEETVYTRPSRRLYSFSFHPHIPEKLYYVNANENKIYRTLQLPSGWTTEEVVYTHTTYVRDMAFAFGKDGELRLYFSEATGAGGNGKIYKIEDGTASLYYKVKLADVGGSWAGDFAFDDKGKLYLSSGNRVPASIYKVEGGRVKEIFRDEKEPITGLVYEDGALYYANWRTKIYHLDLSTGGRTAIYSNSARTWISDVGFREVITPVPAKKPDLVITDISRSDNRIIYGIKNQGNAAAGPSTTYLYVDGSYKASDSIGSMPAGGTLSRSFEYAYTCTPHRDTIKVCADATKKVTESNEANNCKTEVWTCEAPPRKLDIYFADARGPGSVYHYDTTTGIEETVYTRPSRQLFSFTFHPGIPEKLYYVNAIENKIYRTHQTGLGWAPEEVVYTHTTNVKDIAFAFDKDGKLGLYFSEANKIYKIEDSKASLYYEAELADFADVDGFWFGYFAFDDKNNLYLSSANRVPAGIYKVEGGEIKEIFRDEKEPITGLVYEDGALYYANHGTKIYRLDLTTGERTVVYSNPERRWLTDVGFREVITPEKPDLAYIYSTDTTSANSYKSLLDANGYSTTLLPMSDVATTDFSKYGLIIVGGDTGSGYHWGDSASVSAIQDSEKSIIGIYSGGASMFQELGLSINWGHGMFFTESGIYVVKPNHTIFKSPNAILVPPDRIVQLYSAPCSVLGEYTSSLSPEVRLLGRSETYTGHYPLVQEGQNVFWGFTASPESMTGVGKDLFINVVSYMTE